MKRQPKEWGEIFANQISDKGLTPQIDEELVHVNGTTKQNNPLKKRAKDMDRHFFKDDKETANRYVKRCSTSLISGGR